MKKSLLLVSGTLIATLIIGIFAAYIMAIPAVVWYLLSLGGVSIAFWKVLAGWIAIDTILDFRKAKKRKEEEKKFSVESEEEWKMFTEKLKEAVKIFTEKDEKGE
jgi:uncharacterized membrane protein